MRLKPLVVGVFLLASSCHPSFNPAYSAIYKVQPEDTLFGIAYRNGLKLEQLIKANPGIDIRHIKPGAMINVPVDELKYPKKTLPYFPNVPVKEQTIPIIKGIPKDDQCP